MPELIKGIDVSSIQTNVNWPAVAAAGIQFAVIKCGNGNSNIDPPFAHNLAGAKAAGLRVLVYHALFPLPTIPSQPTRDPKWQAQFHFNHSQGEIAAVDLEWPTPDAWVKWGCNAKQIVDWTLAYLEEYEKLSGRKPLIYTYPFFMKALENVPEVKQFANYPLWIASYEPTPTIPKPWDSWILWQDSSGPYHLPITGQAVDTDKVRDLSLWGGAEHSAPAPVAPAVPVPQPVPTPAPVVVAPASVVQPAPTTQQSSWSMLLNLLYTVMKWVFHVR